MSPTSELYDAFRNHYPPGIFSLRETADFHEPIPISERLIQAVWLDQLFDSTALVTRDGQSIQILSPGRWNVEGGPDFKKAHLRIGKQVCRGDVEIHLHTTGWNDHCHHSDMSYNKVILDVCLWDSNDPTPLHTQDGKAVSQLVLYPYLQCSIQELMESLDLDRYPFPSTRLITKPSPLLQLPQKEITRYVDSAGIFRFEQKTAAILEIITQHGRDQAAYQLLAEALGYKHNKLPFRQTSLGLPLASLLGMPSLDSKIDALLAEADRYHLRLNQVRPVNHPHRRLVALALLVEQHPRPADWFLNLLQHPSQLQKPPVLKHPFWSWHYHRHGRRLTMPLALLGATRWKEIMINGVLPFCSAESRARGDPATSQRALEIYLKFPCAQPNRATRQIAYDLGLQSPARAFQQQGLIQIYQDFDLILPDSQPSQKNVLR